jgi:tartronate-semialdehyde synthase
MKTSGGLRHTLARHVEGASHMAEGYTRAAAGNIGVCIGTSGPAGTDMITGLYSATADSIPILCITGQAPVAKLHKEDFQAVDIPAIAKPVTKMAVTVLEPAQVPGTFQQAFHLMRSGRPGPVLIDLPIDVQQAEIEFDVETYAPLPVYKPAATQAQIGRALDLLDEAERPLIVAGGGVINADAADLLVEFAELTGIPVIPTLMAWGSIPDNHPLNAGMVGLQTSHQYGNATMLAADMVIGIAAAGSSTSTSSRLRSVASSRPTTASCPTPGRRSSYSSPPPASARCRTARPGPRNARSASAACGARPTSRTCPSSRSGCMRR